MGERYWVTGVQLGQMKFDGEREQVIEKIIDDQFLGNFPTDKDKKWFSEQLKKLIKKAEKRC